MSFFTNAFTDSDDPFWACYYGVTTHPLYHQCDLCPSLLRCSKVPLVDLMNLSKLPERVPEGWKASKSDFEDRIIEWGLDHGAYKPDEVYWDAELRHYVRRERTFKDWLKRHFRFS